MLRVEKKNSMSYLVGFQREKNLRMDTMDLDLASFGHHHYIAMRSMIGKASWWRLVGST